jgi:hypothetical protein
LSFYFDSEFWRIFCGMPWQTQAHPRVCEKKVSGQEGPKRPLPYNSLMAGPQKTGVWNALRVPLLQFPGWGFQIQSLGCPPRGFTDVKQALGAAGPEREPGLCGAVKEVEKANF